MESRTSDAFLAEYLASCHRELTPHEVVRAKLDLSHKTEPVEVTNDMVAAAVAAEPWLMSKGFTPRGYEHQPHSHEKSLPVQARHSDHDGKTQAARSWATLTNFSPVNTKWLRASERLQDQVKPLFKIRKPHLLESPGKLPPGSSALPPDLAQLMAHNRVPAPLYKGMGVSTTASQPTVPPVRFAKRVDGIELEGESLGGGRGPVRPLSARTPRPASARALAATTRPKSAAPSRSRSSRDSRYSDATNLHSGIDIRSQAVQQRTLQATSQEQAAMDGEPQVVSSPVHPQYQDEQQTDEQLGTVRYAIVMPVAPAVPSERDKTPTSARQSSAVRSGVAGGGGPVRLQTQTVVSPVPVPEVSLPGGVLNMPWEYKEPHWPNADKINASPKRPASASAVPQEIRNGSTDALGQRMTPRDGRGGRARPATAGRRRGGGGRGADQGLGWVGEWRAGPGGAGGGWRRDGRGDEGAISGLVGGSTTVTRSIPRKEKPPDFLIAGQRQLPPDKAELRRSLDTAGIFGRLQRTTHPQSLSHPSPAWQRPDAAPALAQLSVPPTDQRVEGLEVVVTPERRKNNNAQEGALSPELRGRDEAKDKPVAIKPRQTRQPVPDRTIVESQLVPGPWEAEVGDVMITGRRVNDRPRALEATTVQLLVANSPPAPSSRDQREGPQQQPVGGPSRAETRITPEPVARRNTTTAAEGDNGEQPRDNMAGKEAVGRRVGESVVVTEDKGAGPHEDTVTGWYNHLIPEWTGRTDRVVESVLGSMVDTVTHLLSHRAGENVVQADETDETEEATERGQGDREDGAVAAGEEKREGGEEKRESGEEEKERGTEVAEETGPVEDDHSNDKDKARHVTWAAKSVTFATAHMESNEGRYIKGYVYHDMVNASHKSTETDNKPSSNTDRATRSPSPPPQRDAHSAPVAEHSGFTLQGQTMGGQPQKFTKTMAFKPPERTAPQAAGGPFVDAVVGPWPHAPRRRIFAHKLMRPTPMQPTDST